MALTIGSRLGHYTVDALIGEGGMGQVYRATDTKLKRQVALKILPEAFASDPDRLSRFQREAQVLASLNHPNIGQIHGIEDSDGTKALVLELVEGPTLADRIAKNPIPVAEALPIAKQIAEALEAAHERGIIHRDLKPANIKVRDDGTVKVLDFGLAKAYQPEAADPNMSMSPTISLTAAATQMGMIVGTAAYMSPEQAKGKEVDKRVDVWAYGCVLFEMLTAKKLFEANDVSEMLASVLLKDPDLASLPSNVPPELRSLLARCLVKEPKDRLRDIGEVRLALSRGGADAASLSSPSLVTPLVPPQKTPASRPLVLAALASAVVTATVVSLAFWGMRTTDPASVTRFSLQLLPSDILINGPGTAFALSPHGERLVYVTRRGSVEQMYVRSLDQFEGTAIPGTEGARTPFFSPDGEWVGFWADQTLKKIALAGGPPSTLCPAPTTAGGATWGPQDIIVFADRGGGGLKQVSSAGGEPSVVTTVDRDNGELDHLWPEVTPDGRVVLFTVWSGSVETAQVGAVSLETGERVILTGGTQPRYASTGHLLFARQNSLWRAPLDIEDLALTGPAAPVLEPLTVNLGAGAALFTVAANGSLAYVSDQASVVERNLLWVDRDRREEDMLLPEAAYFQPRVSPDGTRVAVQVTGQTGNDVWVHDLARGTEARLTTDPADDGGPLWDPTGERVVFWSRRAGQPSLYWKLADGSGDAELLMTHREFLSPSTWSNGAESLVYTSGASGITNLGTEQLDIGLLSLHGDRSNQVLLATEFHEAMPVVSPDGRWMAYLSNESGQNEVYVQRFPELGDKVTISSNGGSEPLWSRDGRELFYRGPNGMMTVPVTMDPSFQAGSPEVLFEDRYWRSEGQSREYDLAPDGRFLMIYAAGLGSEDGPPPRISVVLNWYEELASP